MLRASKNSRGFRGGSEVYSPPRDWGIESVRIEIGTVWPINGSQFVVHSDVPEFDGISERGKDSFKICEFSDINHSFDAIIKRDSKLVLLQRFDFRDFMHRFHSKGAMGSKGCKALARCQFSMSSPRQAIFIIQAFSHRI